MKTLLRIQKSSRWLAILLAAVVAILTSAVVANATQTITTPNAAFISYNLAAGANSAAITPATNRSVSVMGCCTTLGDRSIGQVSLLHIPSGGITWPGLESYNLGVDTMGNSNTAGPHMVYIDLFDVVDIQVASADTIRDHNGSDAAKASIVTHFW